MRELARMVTAGIPVDRAARAKGTDLVIMQALTYCIEEHKLKYADELAVKIANAVGKMLGGK